MGSSDIMPVASKEFLDIQATMECGFTLKHICDMIRTYSHSSKLNKNPENYGQKKQ